MPVDSQPDDGTSTHGVDADTAPRKAPESVDKRRQSSLDRHQRSLSSKRTESEKAKEARLQTNLKSQKKICETESEQAKGARLKAVLGHRQQMRETESKQVIKWTSLRTFKNLAPAEQENTQIHNPNQD